MIRSNRTRHAGVALFAAALASPAALGGEDSIRRQIDAGNAHLAAGRYDDALQSYQEAQRGAGESPPAELLHDLAVAQFKLGRLGDARELWVRAAGMRDALFESRARFNLGNCDFAEAREAAGDPQQRQAASKLLERAMLQYRDALRLDPGLADARANLELAARFKQQLDAEQPPSSQGTDSGPSSRPESQPESQPSSQSSDQSSSDSQNQGENSSQSQPSSQPHQEPQEEPDSQPASQPQSQPQAASQPQESPASQPEQPQAESQPQSQPSDGQAEPQPAERTDLDLTRQEAERLLQMVRDMERQRRKLAALREAARQKPVDKDW